MGDVSSNVVASGKVSGVVDEPKSRKLVWILLGIILAILILVILVILSFFSVDLVSGEAALNLTNLAQETGNHGECGKIIKGPYKDSCYLAMAYSLGDSDLCDKVSEGDYKQYCLKHEEDGGYSFNTSRAVWMSSIGSLNNVSDVVKFDYYFNSTGDARGKLTVFFDGEVVYEVDEANVVKGKVYDSGYIYLGEDYEAGEYLLSVYNIPLNEEKSFVTVSDIEFGKVNTEDLERLGEPEIIITDYPIDDADWFGAGYSDGVFTTSGDGVNFSGPAWITTFVDVSEPVNQIDFEAEFIGENGVDGVATFYWDNKKLWDIDGRYNYLAEDNMVSIFPPTWTAEEIESFESLYENLTEEEAWALGLANSTPEELMALDKEERDMLYFDYAREISNRHVPYGSYEFSIRVDQYTEVPVAFRLINMRLSYHNSTGNVIFPHCHKPCTFEY